MKRKKGKSRHWTRKKKSRETAKLEEDDAGEMKKKKKKKKMDGTEATTEAGWSSAVAELPLDVWGDICSRLPFKQVVLCRCTCRAWNAFLARFHRHPNPTTHVTLLYCPWLCLRRVSGMPLRNYLTLAELRNGASYESTVKRIDDCYNYLCGGGDTTDDNFLWPVASCHGLVCFVREMDWDRGKNIFVGNPLLKEHLLELPPSEINMKTKGSQVVGFGFSPGANRYKIVKFSGFSWLSENHQSHFLICTVGEGSGRSSSMGRGKRQVCLPSWRRLLSFPLHFRRYPCGMGSHLNAGIHWLVSDSDKDDGSVFISRLDLDTEQFGRVEAPQSPDFKDTPFEDLSLSVSGGHLIICALLNLSGQDIINIWVMNEFNSWTKTLVVRSPIPANCAERVELLNYGEVEAAAREGAVAEVMLLVRRCRLYACTTRGRHLRQVDHPLDGDFAIVHIPSFLSVKDVAKL